MRTAAWSLAVMAGTAFAAPSSDGWGNEPQGYGYGWGESSSSSSSSTVVSATPTQSIPVYKTSSTPVETPSSSSSVVSSATPSSSSSTPVSATPASSTAITTSSVSVYPVSSSSVSIDTTCTESESTSSATTLSKSSSVVVTTSSSVSSSTPVISKYTTASSSVASSSSVVNSATPSSSTAVSTPSKASSSAASSSKPHSTWTRTTEVHSTTTVLTTAYTTVSTCTETHTTGGSTVTTTFVTTGYSTATVTSVVQVTPVPKSSAEVWATTGTSVWAQGSSGTGETTTIATTTSTSTIHSTLTLTVPKPTGTGPAGPDTTITLTTTSLTTVCPATCAAETSAPLTTVTKVTSVYTTICPVTETQGSITKTYDSTSQITSTWESTITLTTSALTYGTNTWSLTVPVPVTTSAPAGYPTKSHGHGHGHHSKHSSKFASLLSSASKASHAHSSASKAPVSSASKLPHQSVTKSSSSAVSTPTGPPKPYGDHCIPCEGQPGSDPNTFCGFDVHTNSYENTPITCVHRTYDFTISNITISPDGVERYGLVVNGQLPGPKVEANWGDWISITVHNQMENNGTTIHMHGLRQYYTNEADGVPSITQCPIAPGDSYTYTFRADNYGSSWYHSHFSLQTYEGVFGPVVIHGPTSAPYDIEESIVLSDWNHIPVDQMFDAAQAIGPPPTNGPRTLDTGLINGKNVWGAVGALTGERYVLNVQANKRYLLRVVSSSIQATWKFSVDGHKFTVIANDFVPITPYETEVLSINIGQRYDLILETNQLPGNYWMRSTNQQSCSDITNGAVTAIVRYEGAPEILPISVGYVTGDDCLDEPLASLVPVVPFTVGAATETVNERIFITGYNNSVVNNVYRWTLSDAFFQVEWGTPSLGGIVEDGEVPYTGNLVIEAPELGEWVYLIIDSLIPVPHPIHLHGHDFFVLAQGPGVYDSSVALNLNNPPRRDVAMMAGHLVIAFKTDNPGVWLLHCHIGWHNAMGFALQIVENLENIAGTVQRKGAMDATCAKWDAYTKEDDIKVIDSGV